MKLTQGAQGTAEPHKTCWCSGIPLLLISLKGTKTWVDPWVHSVCLWLKTMYQKSELFRSGFRFSSGRRPGAPSEPPGRPRPTGAGHAGKPLTWTQLDSPSALLPVLSCGRVPLLKSTTLEDGRTQFDRWVCSRSL